MLKEKLVEYGDSDPEQTHDLLFLLGYFKAISGACIPEDIEIKTSWLNKYYTETRYPSNRPLAITDETAELAYEYAVEIVDCIDAFYPGMDEEPVASENKRRRFFFRLRRKPKF